MCFLKGLDSHGDLSTKKIERLAAQAIAAATLELSVSTAQRFTAEDDRPLSLRLWKPIDKMLNSWHPTAKLREVAWSDFPCKDPPEMIFSAGKAEPKLIEQRLAAVGVGGRLQQSCPRFHQARES